jgi:hypothetical protein
MIHKEDITKINAVPISSVADIFGLHLDSAGRGPCPTGHESKSGKPFSLYEVKNIAHCFHCLQSWDTISLYRQFRGCSFRVAIQDLANRFGITLSDQTGNPTGKKFQRRSNPSIDKLVTEQSTVKEIEKKFRDQEEDLLDKLWTFLDIKSIVENEIKAIDRMLRRLDMVRRDAREAMTKRIQTARLAVREGINETV